jgi:alcohol dehydrogenase YqhD (iron-dependent ADH family)
MPVRKFELYNPIRMIFGTGEFERLGEVAKQYGKKPLVVVGRSHAKTCGLLDRGVEILRNAGLDPVVFEGVEPNPSVATCRKASLLARENDCDMVVGIGGGSVMDASKVIAFGFFDPDNIWNYVDYWNPGYKPVKQALPIVLVSTLAATGSEGDSGAVITNDETMEKAGVTADGLFPMASIIDPELTMTVSVDYTRDGAIDMMLHVLEGYFNEGESTPFADRCTEAFVVEVMLALASVLENPTDSDARGQLSYLGAIALNGFINRPRGGAFPMHRSEEHTSELQSLS